ncbi:MAG: MAPEG family protein [Pseudomonadota bacterium]
MPAALLAPVFIQVVLTFALLFMMGGARYGAVKGGRADAKEISVNSDAYPEDVRIASNCFRNQFELPTLFYAVTAFALIAGAQSHLMTALAWAFALTRLLHAFVFVVTKNLNHRFLAYLAGAVILMVMWALLAYKTLLV